MPKFFVLLNPILGAYHELGGRADNGEITERVINVTGLKLTTLERNDLHFELIPRARTFLKEIGLVEHIVKARRGTPGEWQLTTEGRETSELDLEEVSELHRRRRKKSVGHK